MSQNKFLKNNFLSMKCTKKQKTAFSLIELSIVILIISILIAGSLSTSQTSVNNNKNQITKERMQIAYDALASFVLLNKRLPCPADITAQKGAATYGDEADSVVNDATLCDGLTSSTDITATNLVYGMLPLKALGIDVNMAEDGFGTKFSYAVDKRFTKKTDSDQIDGFEAQRTIKAPVEATPLAPIITIQSPLGSDIMSNALLVIISHGANKYGGYNSTGTLQNSAPTITGEINNMYSEDLGIPNYNNIFVTSSTDANFDDVVLFKNKVQLARDAGWEFMTCLGIEASENHSGASGGGGEPAPWTWDNTLYNGGSSSNSSIACSGTGLVTTGNPNGSSNAAKLCKKYGVWGGIKYDKCT
jgi:prepilin-type N-terminal cleavage/methylation domain-containing protein